MAVESKTFAIVAAVVGGAGLAALILSFASDRWLEASNFEDSGFANLGLWSICFEGKYRPPTFAAISREYEGCWWALNKELDDLRSFLFPEWFRSTQILVTVGLVLVLIVTILMVVNFINCFPYSRYKHRIKRGLALISSLFLFLAAILLTVAVILFGVKATDSRTWIQNPDNNFLSWSFGMCILADFLFIIAGMCLILQFMRLRTEKDDPDDSEPKVMLTNEAPPGTNYRYTPGRNTMVREDPVAQPAYVQRYAKNQNSRPPPQNPNSLFAVSGSGDVYINRLADYDEKNDDFRDGYKERGRRGQPPPWHQQKTDTKRSNPQLDVSVDGTYTGSDYEKSKNVEHPVLPEYTPKSTRKANGKKPESISDTETVDSVYKDEKKKRKKDNKEDQKGERKSRSSSRKKRSNSRDRSRSGSRSRKKNMSESEYSDSESTRKRSKHRSRSRDDSDDEGSRSRRRSKKGSKRRRKSRSRSRSKSRDRDLNTTYSDSQLDSDSGSVRSRSRRRHEKDSKKHSSREDVSRKDKKRHSSSDKHKKKKSGDGNVSDDKLGSEYSHQRSRRKEGRDSDVDSKKRLRDFSETESVRSNRSRNKPKGTYSSYYE